MRQNSSAFRLGIFEVPQRGIGIANIEIPTRIFGFGLTEYIAVSEANRRSGTVERYVHNVVDFKDMHGQSFQTIGDLARNRSAIVAANLLEIGELRDFHSITPDFPSQSPRAKRRTFPVVFNESNVMQSCIDSHRAQGFKVKVL